ncbi:MAG TPA: CBS domain-containing protein [Thermoanaerobaculia bacterium]|nr:CBS domain-containing protein [Thermoanaerobaculia bacterium]
MRHIQELIDGRDLVLADSGATVKEVAQAMSEQNVGAVPVLDRDRLVGVFSERDIMSRVVARGLNPDQTTVRDVMTSEIVVAEADDTVSDALQKMHSRGCRHLPVVREGSLVGMISLRDLLQIDTQETKERATFLSELVTYSPDYES